MKKRAISLTAALLVAIICIASLSSCFMLDNGGNGAIPDGATINVQGGDTYHVNIENPVDAKVTAAAKGLMSAVSIIAYHSGYNSGYGSGFGSGDIQGAARGSGIIYKMDKSSGTAYIVTNHHVLYDKDTGISRNIKVMLYGQETSDYAINATYVGGSLQYDLAVLKISSNTLIMSSNMVEATVADSNNVQVLESVIAIGNAQGDGIAVTAGHVNVESEYITILAADEKTEVNIRVIRTDAAVNPGNSGGGLFNLHGELIGIVNAKSISSDVDNMGYAIPSNVVKGIADNIIYYCDNTQKTTPYKCTLGISVISTNPEVLYDEKTGTLNRIELVKISSVDTATSDIKNKILVGDIITKITVDGKETAVTRRHHVIDAMLDARVGSKIVLTLIRDGQTFNCTVTATSGMINECK